MSQLHPEPCPRWLHYWALLAVVATLPLLTLGAEVTTKQVGMVDSQGLRTPWHMLEVSLVEKGLGYVIEHSHRLAGFVVGTCVIVLAIGLWRFQSQRWLQWLGLVALTAVVAQGMLGIFRIELNVWMGRNLALIHGCFAQIVFALLASIALITSRYWQTALEREQQGRDVHEREKSCHLARLLTALVYGQLVLGAIVRHRDFPWGARLHLLGAFVVVAALGWWMQRLVTRERLARQEVWAIRCLVVLLGVQVLLGMEAWISKFYPLGTMLARQVEPLSVSTDFLRSAHYVVGAMLFATTVVITLQVHRRAGWRLGTLPSLTPAPQQLEGNA